MKFKLIFLLCLLLIILSTGCIDSSSFSTELSVGDTGITEDNIAFTVQEYALVDNLPTPYGNTEPPEGAKFLLIYVNVTNVGDVKSPYFVGFPKIDYKGSEITAPNDNVYFGSNIYKPTYRGYHGEYPSVSKEGWIKYTVPAGINLEETHVVMKNVKIKIN